MDSWKFDFVCRGHDDYEKARRKAVWNGSVPDRYPKIIAYPEHDEQVQEIVRTAKESRLSVAVKSGGHSWSAAFLRDGGILVDLIKMRSFTFDIDAKTAEVQPAAYASELNEELLHHKMMFPGGHCPTVGMGGYLLQGGFGWNSGRWGMACESVLAIDLVTADGELIHANSKQNTDYFWAARGAGCAYFGLVTRFYLKLHPLPPGIMTSRYIFEVADLDEVLIGIDSIWAEIPLDLEICMFAARDQDGISDRPTVAITMDAFSDSQEEARAALNMVHQLPAFRKSIISYEFISCTLKQMMQRLDDILDNRGLHYQVDNMWTEVPVKKLLPAYHKIIQGLPPGPAHLYMNWWNKNPRPEMAFSMEARIYVAMYIISTDPTTDAPHARYVRESMELLQEHEKGIQLADENLPQHPGKFMATHKFIKLEQLRQKYDPEGRFYGYLRVPEEFSRSWANL